MLSMHSNLFHDKVDTQWLLIRHTNITDGSLKETPPTLKFARGTNTQLTGPANLWLEQKPMDWKI
jgi:hypothetical protein